MCTLEFEKHSSVNMTIIYKVFRKTIVRSKWVCLRIEGVYFEYMIRGSKTFSCEGGRCKIKSAGCVPKARTHENRVQRICRLSVKRFDFANDYSSIQAFNRECK